MSDIQGTTKNLGEVTAYGEALVAGYDGTYEEFCEMLANYGKTAAEVRDTNTLITKEYNTMQQLNKDAQNSATKAESYAVGGTGFADHEGEDTDNAKYYSEQSANSATLSQSWTEGGTSTRDGEDKNNAKYWAEQANQRAIDADKSADRIEGDQELTDKSQQKAAENEELSHSYAIGGTGTKLRENEDTDNSKYYSEQSSNSADASDKSRELSQSYAVGGTGTTQRTGEDTDNSKYYSEQSSDSADTSKEWAVGPNPIEGNNTPGDKNNAYYWSEVARQFSEFNAPNFYIDWATMELVEENAFDRITFSLDENAILSYETNLK